MWYLIFYGLFALWVLFDSIGRKNVGIGIVWAIGTALVGPLALPVYLATRPLRTGEVREGGTGWNVLKNFAILWTIVMTVVTFNAFLAMGKLASTAQGDAAKAGAGLGIILGLGLLLVVWIVPTGGAALLGFLLKKNSIVERGPTGPLVGDSSPGSFATGWTGVLATAVVALIAVGAVSTRQLADGTTPSTSGAPVQQETLAAPDATLHWIYNESPDKMGRGTVRTAIVRSINEIEFGLPYSGRQRGTLMLRVHPKYGKNVILSIERGQFLCRFDGCSASVRFDQGKPETYSASEPADNSTTYLFIGNYDRFLRGLRKSRKVSVEAQFYQEGSQVFEFDTSGLEW